MPAKKRFIDLNHDLKGKPKDENVVNRVRSLDQIDPEFSIKIRGRVITKQQLEQKKKELEERFKKLAEDKEAKLQDLKDAEKYLEIPNTRFRLKFFDITKINTKKEGQRVGIFGKTGSGKSYVAKAIMWANRTIPWWVVMCQSEPVNHQYGMHMENDLTIYDYYDENGLNEVKLRQTDFCSKNKVPGSEPPKYVNDPSLTVLLDDLAEYESEMRKSRVLGYLHCVSRHHNVLFIELYQYYAQLIKKYRRQLSWVIVMNPNSETDIKDMHKEFFGMFSYPEFKKVIMKATTDHGCLVLDALSDSANIEERVFYYRAPYPSLKFKVGTRWSRKLQKHFYKKNWEVKNVEEAQEAEQEILQNMEQERYLIELEQELKEQEKLLNKFEKEKKNLEKRKSKITRDIDLAVPPPSTHKQKTTKIEKPKTNTNNSKKRTISEFLEKEASIKTPTPSKHKMKTRNSIFSKEEEEQIDMELLNEISSEHQRPQKKMRHK